MHQQQIQHPDHYVQQQQLQQHHDHDQQRQHDQQQHHDRHVQRFFQNLFLKFYFKYLAKIKSRDSL